MLKHKTKLVFYSSVYSKCVCEFKCCELFYVCECLNDVVYKCCDLWYLLNFMKKTIHNFFTFILSSFFLSFGGHNHMGMIWLMVWLGWGMSFVRFLCAWNIVSNVWWLWGMCFDSLLIYVFFFLLWMLRVKFANLRWELRNRIQTWFVLLVSYISKRNSFNKVVKYVKINHFNWLR